MVITKAEWSQGTSYFLFPLANWRLTSSWSAMSVASAWWVLSLFFFFFLCFFLALASASSDCGSSFWSSVVGSGGGLGDGDRRRLFFFFFWGGGGVVWVMKMSASSSVSSSRFSTSLRFFAAEGPFRGLLFFFARFILLRGVVVFHRAGNKSAFFPVPGRRFLVFVLRAW